MLKRMNTRRDNDSPTEMDNLIDNMELPEPTFNNGGVGDVHESTHSVTVPRRSSVSTSTPQSHNTHVPELNNGARQSTRRASHIPSTSRNGSLSNRLNISPLPPLSELYGASSINSDPSIPEVIIATPSNQSDNGLDVSIQRYNRKTEVQKASEYYAKVENMEREETIKCFISSMLFILIVVFLIILMFTINPSM